MCEVTLGKHRLLTNVPHQDKAFSLVETEGRGEDVCKGIIFAQCLETQNYSRSRNKNGWKTFKFGPNCSPGSSASLRLDEDEDVRQLTEVTESVA